jgi:hypothetical protein
MSHKKNNRVLCVLEREREKALSASISSFIVSPTQHTNGKEQTVGKETKRKEK